MDEDTGDSIGPSLLLEDDCLCRVPVGVVDVLRDAPRLPGCLGGATVLTVK